MRVTALAVAFLAVAAVTVAVAQDDPEAPPPPPTATAPAQEPPVEEVPPDAVEETIVWRDSRPLGKPWAGRLVRGVLLPEEGADYFTWDPVFDAVPNRAWRRWGSDSLIRTLLAVLREYTAAHPEAPRVAVGDLSRPFGGRFGKRFGGRGHASHQNGLDVDVYYPRRDRRERAPRTVAQVDQRLAQDLVDRFIAAGAAFVFVGTGTRLTGPPAVVQAIAYHDDHMHVRIRPRRGR